MSIIRERAKLNFPVVLLTLLSIVQALALELLWDNVHSRESLFDLSLPALVSWLQILSTFLAIIIIWLSYATNALRFRWVPSTSDTMFPFLVGVAQFVLIDNIGVDRIGPWLICLATIFALMTWISHHDLKRARQDPENAEFFVELAPATLKDFAQSLTVVAVMSIMGIYFWNGDRHIWIAICVASLALVMLVYQLYLTDVFWKRSMNLDNENQD